MTSPSLDLDIGDLYRRYYPMVARRVGQFVVASEVEAVAHAVFSSVLERGHEFRNASSPVALLYRLTTDHCATRLRLPREVQPDIGAGDGDTRSISGFDRDGHLTELGLARVLYESFEVGAGHVEGCPACAHVLATMRAEDDAVMIPLPEQKPKRRVRRTQVGGTLVFVSVVAVIFLAVRSQPELFGGGVSPSSPSPGEQRPLGLTVYVQDGRERRVVATGGEVRPGDEVRFEVHVGKPGFVMVLGVDDHGGQFVRWPAGDDQAAVKLEGSGEPVLSKPLVFAGTTGNEHLIALWCERSFVSSDVAQSVSASLSSPGAKMPAGCTMVRVDLRKVGR